MVPYQNMEISNSCFIQLITAGITGISSSASLNIGAAFGSVINIFLGSFGIMSAPVAVDSLPTPSTNRGASDIVREVSTSFLNELR